jgi:50S ribosomal protein L16 3-hydroxylase
MLYLPPHYAHDGVALTACTTYSIGFRAAAANELAAAFLDFLRDELDLPGRYADPDLRPTRTPARIAPMMQRRCARLLGGIRWDRERVARFVGSWLSEPKPHVFFEPPARPLARAAFARRAAARGLRLNPRTQLLYDDRYLYVNGTALPWPAEGAALLARIANGRALTAADARSLPAQVMTMLHGWYRDGFLEPDGD